jgi:hypothetical protein
MWSMTARSWLTIRKVRPRSAPQAAQKVQHLGLNGGIQRRGRFVQQQDLRFQHQRAGDGDALALAAGQLVRIAEAEAGGQAHIDQRLHHAASLSPVPWIASGSDRVRSMVWRGWRLA